MFGIFGSCSSQSGNNKHIDRYPAVAGSFYPSDSKILIKTLDTLFGEAKPKSCHRVAAIIVPHAGYVYSGEVAASGFNQLEPDKQYKTVFVIGSSHRAGFEGASVYRQGNYITPLGTLETDTAIAGEIVKKHKVFGAPQSVHIGDHVLEVEMPFLQYKLKPGFKIVPILIGKESEETCKKIAEGLKPYFTDDNLFVISADFSHYPPYAQAVMVDRKTRDAILTGSSAELLKSLRESNGKNIDNLTTPLCSWTSVLTLLYITETTQGMKPVFIDYKNSGDNAGDKKRVVGYNCIAFCRESVIKENKGSGEFIISEDEKRILLQIARTTIEEYIRNKKIFLPDTSQYSELLKSKAGAFVTLHEYKQLRGCIGRFMPDAPLWKVVRDMAIASSTEDTRFNPVSVKELEKIDIEISVLSPLQKIKNMDEIILGKHGIYIKKGFSSGTFLPQVATETGWNKEEFLGHCSRDKAGMGWDGWKNAEIYIYSAVVFSEKEK